MLYCLLQYTVYYVYAVCCDVTHGSVVEIRKCDLLSASCEVHDCTSIKHSFLVVLFTL